MKIALPVYLHGFGGAERQVITLGNQMAYRGHEVHMLLLSDDKIKYPLSDKIKVHSLLYAEKGNTINKILNRRRALISKLKELKCDVIVNFNFQSAYLLTLFKTKDIGKVIYSERGDPGDKEYKGLMGLIRKSVLHKIDGYVFQSQGAREYFNDGYVNDHSVVIPNACFLPQSVPSSKRSKRIVSVGRLSAQKNQSVLIKAFAKVSTEFPDYILQIFGDGELRDELIMLIRNLGIENKVKLMGTTSNLSEAIKDASLFVLSSDYEGIPNALIEAMALGLPCVSTDCKPGGAKTLISNDVDGIITPIQDIEALANAMGFMLSHPDEAVRMAINATEITNRLAPEVIYHEWEQFIENI